MKYKVLSVTLWLSSEVDVYSRQQLMKATVFVESFLYLIFSPEYLRYHEVYRRESDRCHTLPFFLMFLLLPVYKLD